MAREPRFARARNAPFWELQALSSDMIALYCIGTVPMFHLFDLSVCLFLGVHSATSCQTKGLRHDVMMFIVIMFYW